MFRTLPSLVLLCIQVAIAAVSSARCLAQIPATGNDTASPHPADNFVAAVLAADPTGEPAELFSTETPKLYLRWHGEGFAGGEKLRCIWIAENVGDAAPPNYHVDEASAVATAANNSGIFTLSKPKTGWPPGAYRVELYVGDRVAISLPFSIEEHRGD